jgi:hypothetical protein
LFDFVRDSIQKPANELNVNHQRRPSATAFSSFTFSGLA